MKIHKYLVLLAIFFGLLSVCSMYILHYNYLIEIGIVGYYVFLVIDILYMIGDIVVSAYKMFKKS